MCSGRDMFSAREREREREMMMMVMMVDDCFFRLICSICGTTMCQ